MSTDNQAYQGSGNTTFSPNDDRTLSEAVLGAIEAHRDIDLVEADFTLYESINPDALERLFRFNQNAATTVSFVIDGTHVSLRDLGDEIEIQVDDV
ncbi:HalOD1 output domain-containing protein [Haloterrigena salinisoli]|uniref:HalOD1 output domain-containing protein n=1 Tax=Haloterrigena salinisoli TaxID=3132747 RepID=UPI0030D14C93